jgi:DNA-binding NtrC family response regulator
VLFLQGEAGSPFELFARELAEISAFRDGPVMACDAAEFEPRRLIEVLAPSLLSGDAGTLIVSGVETFTAEQQATLGNLLTGRDVFLPFARRFRLVVSATQALADRVDAGDFDDTLFYKLSAVSLTVPALRAMRGDIAANARQILTQGGATEAEAAPVAFSADAMAWLEAQTWPGNYDQLAQTVILARDRSGKAEIGVPALETAFRQTAHGKGVRIVDVFAQTPAKPVAAAPVAAPARPQSAPPLAAKSLFRPASTAYNFNQRLTDLLGNAEAVPAR